MSCSLCLFLVFFLLFKKVYFILLDRIGIGEEGGLVYGLVVLSDEHDAPLLKHRTIIAASLYIVCVV